MRETPDIELLPLRPGDEVEVASWFDGDEAGLRWLKPYSDLRHPLWAQVLAGVDRRFLLISVVGTPIGFVDLDSTRGDGRDEGEVHLALHL